MGPTRLGRESCLGLQLSRRLIGRRPRAALDGAQFAFRAEKRVEWKPQASKQQQTGPLADIPYRRLFSWPKPTAARPVPMPMHYPPLSFNAIARDDKFRLSLGHYSIVMIARVCRATRLSDLSSSRRRQAERSSCGRRRRQFLIRGRTRLPEKRRRRRQHRAQARATCLEPDKRRH